MAKTKYYKVIGQNEYNKTTDLMINKDLNTGKIHILSSEEGDPVVLSVKETKELIEILKKCIKD